MTNEELVQLIAAGNDTLIDDLWAQVEKFVGWRAHNFYYAYQDRCLSLCIEIDDLIQEGYFALLKGIEKYDPARGTKFLTAFEYYLKASFYTMAKMHYTGWQRNKVHKCEHLEAPIENTDGLTLLDTVIGDEDVIEKAEHDVYMAALLPALAKSLQSVTDRQREMIASIYIDGLTYELTAQKYNITRGGVQRAVIRGMEHLRNDVQLQALYAY